MAISGYIIEKYNNMTGAYTCNRLLEEGRKLGMEVDLIGVYDTFATGDGVYNIVRSAGSAEECGCAESTVSAGSVTADGLAGRESAVSAGPGTQIRRLEKRDFCIRRYKPGTIKNAAASFAERSYNREDAFEKYMSKYEQLKDISSKAFKMPKYVLAKTSTPYETLASMLGEEFVVKGLYGSMGREVFLVGGSGEYARFQSNTDPEGEWLFEEFIEESAGRDLRVYVVRGEAVACMERRSKEGFKANVALGADVFPHPITDEIRLAAKDVYERTGLDFIGLDLLFSRDGLCFCEINVTPGIEGIERASGVNVAGIVMSTIQNDFK